MFLYFYNGVSDENLEVSNENLRVSDEKVEVSDKNLWVSDEKVGVFDKNLWVSDETATLGSPIELRWWWFLPRLGGLVEIKNSPFKYISSYLEIYIFTLCLFVCLYISNQRQNGWTDQAQIFCGTSCDPREGLWMIKFSKICLHQNSIFENFGNPRNFFLKIR